RVPTNDDAATVTITAVAVGRTSWRTRPATYPTITSASAQRPATWSAGGARSRRTPATNARTAGNGGPGGRAAPTTTSRQRLGTMPCHARCGNRETWRTRARPTARPAARARNTLIALLRSLAVRAQTPGAMPGAHRRALSLRSLQAPVGFDDGPVTRGAG